MAKKAKKQAVVTEDVEFSLDNLESLNTKGFKDNNSETESFTFNLRIRLDMFNKWNQIKSEVAFKLYNYNPNLINHKDFFELVVNSFVNDLKKKRKFEKATEIFLMKITKRGRRQNGNRTVTKPNKNMFLGQYSGTAFKDDYYSLLYSLALLNKFVNEEEYNHNYFFFDIHDYLINNYEKIIKEQSDKDHI